MDSVNDSVSKHTGFPHSEIAGYNGSYHLTDAYRRLARPSSPLTARASTVLAFGYLKRVIVIPVVTFLTPPA